MNSDFHLEEITVCRLCRHVLPERALICMHPFPLAAQHFPTTDKIKDNVTTCEVFKCLKCGLVQLKAKPVAYYRSVITAASLSPKAREARLAEIREFVSKYNPGRNALEVGCGKGGMLDVLSDAGFDVQGIEFEKVFVEEALSSERKVTCSYLSEYEPDSKFDVIFSFNYLEHQPDVVEFLDNLNRITSERAFIYLTVPNLDYLLRTNSFYEFVPDHLVYFSQQTLQLAFQLNGFDVHDCQLINNENDILLVASKRPLLDLHSDYVSVESLISELNSLTNSYIKRGKKIAVWGAGHRTLALLALSNLLQISCVVDSAPFKQGLFTPVLLKPIISPDEFAASDIDAVIVAVPGIYPQEVIKTIRSFKKMFEIYCIEDNQVVNYN
ncbi:class I SAM-dependent methyltransferase [Pseudoalteromonas xiamenensis]|uniref:class I SAM-dependent methyltransferase n=1 Tax=Pseudoalteromonas xiamenensis TaxID=882626 RepID=UPI0035E6EA7B